ncbi:MAG TPA: GNAT family N-acetyltransferase [Cellulomonas sp.]
MTRVADLPDGWASDPYLLAELGARDVLAAWSTPAALVVALDAGRRGTGLHGLGDPVGVAALLDVHAGEIAALAPDYLTATRGTWDAVTTADRLGLAARGSDWDWWCTHGPLDVDTDGVVRLGEGSADLALVADCLARAHPAASTRPDDPAVLGWWGVPAREVLVGVIGAVRLGEGLAPHLVSLGVDPVARGRGLAGRLLGAAVRDALREPVEIGPSCVSLGMYADNDAARRVYQRLGWTLAHEFTSRDRVGRHVHGVEIGHRAPERAHGAEGAHEPADQDLTGA